MIAIRLAAALATTTLHVSNAAPKATAVAAMQAEQLTRLADNTTVVPGGGGVFNFFSAPTTAGKFVLWNGAGDEQIGAEAGHYRVGLGQPQQEVEKVLATGDPMPCGGAINETGDASLLQDGAVLFFAASDPTLGRGVGSLLLAPPPTDRSSGFELAATVGDNVPDGGGKIVRFGESLQASGSIAAGCHLAFSANTDGGITGLFVASRPAAGQSAHHRRTEESESWVLTKVVDNTTSMPAPDSESKFVQVGGAEGGSPVSLGGDRVVFFGGNGKMMTDPLARHGVYQWDNKEGISTVIESNATKVPGMDGDGWHFAGFGSIALAQNDNGAVICMMADAANDLDPAVVGIWCRKQLAGQPAGQLELVVSSRSVIPDSPEPTSPQNLFQYVDYPAVTLGTDPGLSDYMVVFQGNDGLGRRGVYRALGDELRTVTDWQRPFEGSKPFNIQLNIPALGQGGEAVVALWMDLENGNEGIFVTEGEN